MGEYETAQAIADRAAEWVARIDRARVDPQTQAELDAWLAGDDRRRGAFFRASAAWNMLDRASVLRPSDRKGVCDGAKSKGRVSRRRFLFGGSAIAASVVAVNGGHQLWQGRVERIETAIGEIRRVPLKDGSLAAVNTLTKLAIIMSPEIRRIALDQGEAWFQVAKDPSRPFVVEAGEVRVRALGTAFSVRRLESGAEVRVTEGLVEVWSVGSEAKVRRVAAGSRASVHDEDGMQQVIEASADIDRSLAWRSGEFIFDGDTLGQAVAQFNRYNAVQLTIDSPALAAERLVGRFHINEPDAFADAAARMLGAHVSVTPARIILSRN
jgi:transmembrane sensor